MLYNELAEWWPLLSDPADYEEEAEIYRSALLASAGTTVLSTILELGSGGGNNASHLKKHFQMTLVDLSVQMLTVSEKLNPECIHVNGDMRTVRLGQTFDGVFIHDAIIYMKTREQLKQAVDTAYMHCKPRGLALFVPDWTVENFRPTTSHGGHDKGDRGLRYLEWTMDQDPSDGLYSSYMIYLMKDKDCITQSGIDEHVCGLFSEAGWLETIKEAGFIARTLPYNHSEFAKGDHFMFMGFKE
jgi:ubiquinone/menaquinone biosynthesis C-methylase UbiE